MCELCGGDRMVRRPVHTEGPAGGRTVVELTPCPACGVVNQHTAAKAAEQRLMSAVDILAGFVGAGAAMDERAWRAILIYAPKHSVAERAEKNRGLP